MNTTELVVGDSYQYDTNIIGYPANAGWTFKQRLTNLLSTGTGYTLTSTGQGEFHRTTISTTLSSSFAPGEYSWYGWVESSAERHTVSSGFVTITGNPATSTAGTDPRSHARKMLDAIEAVLEGRATSDMSSYMIAGRQVVLLSPDALIRWRGHYKSLVRAEERAAGSGKASGLRVKFVN